MKKMFTLLLSVGILATSYAQPNRQQNDKNFGKSGQNVIVSNGHNKNIYGRNDHGIYDNRNPFARERDAQIDKINREFSYKVKAVENNRYMRSRQKKVAIRDLTNERNRQLQMVNARYNDKFRKAYGKNNQGRR